MTKNRFFELDGLRGLAALAVVFYHYTIRYHELFGHSFTPHTMLSIGYYGVHLFFTISGFVIFWSVSNNPRISAFIKARFFRLFPVYWVAIICTFLTVNTFGLSDRAVNLSELAMNFTMLQGFFNIKPVDGVYWTLTLELAFYLSIVTICLLRLINYAQIIFILWIAFTLFIKFYSYKFALPDFAYKLFIYHYIEFFSAGIVLFKLKQNNQSPITHLLSCTIILSLFIKHDAILALSFVALFFVFYLIANFGFKPLQTKIFVFFGSISYSLYLLHQNIGYVVINQTREMGMPAQGAILCAFAVSIGLAYLLTRFVEIPCVAFGKAMQKSKS
jgi:peptidoglycan/LPS O-acetylase OafA/YrhL